MTRILAIDPGASGGMAWTNHDGIAMCEKMPDGMAEQIDRLRNIIVGNMIDRVYLEKVGSYMQGNSATAACTFARHCGHLEAGVYTLCIPCEQVAPTVWMKAIGTMPKEKRARKNGIKEVMARLYPHLQVTLATADALGILTWAMSRK